MTQNIEQRTNDAVTMYESASKKVTEFADSDSKIETSAGLRDSFPMLSREFNEKNQAQINEQANVFQKRFAALKEKEWSSNIEISNPLQPYWRMDGATKKTYLANPVLLPFTTSSDWQTESSLGRWIECSILTKNHSVGLHESATKVVSATSLLNLKKDKIDAVDIMGRLFENDFSNANCDSNLMHATQDGEIKNTGEGYGLPLFNSHVLKKRNQIMLEECARKLRSHELLQMQWFGDSNSEGDNGEVINSFYLSMKKLYPNLPVIIRRDKSGMTTHRVWSWKAPDNNSELSIINLGTNDALWGRHAKNGGVLRDYEFNLRALASREILRDKAVVIVSLLPQRIDFCQSKYGTIPITSPWQDNIDSIVRPDSMALVEIARKVSFELGCTFVDSQELMSLYSDSIFNNASNSTLANNHPYGDPIHIKAKFKATWGKYIASAICGDGLVKKKTGSSGEIFQLRQGIDPIISTVGLEPNSTYQSGLRYDLSSESCNAFSEGVTGSFFRALKVDANKIIAWSFYSESADLIVTPVLFGFANAKIKLSYNFGIEPIPFLIDPNRVGTQGGWNNNGLSDIEITHIGNFVNVPSSLNYEVANEQFNSSCHLKFKGWHTIIVEVIEGSVMASGVIIDNERSIDINNLANKIHYIKDIGSSPNLDNYTDFGDYSFVESGEFFNLHVTHSKSKNLISQITISESGVIKSRMKKRGSGWNNWEEPNNEKLETLIGQIDLNNIVNGGNYIFGDNAIANVPNFGDGNGIKTLTVKSNESGTVIEQVSISIAGSASRLRLSGNWTEWKIFKPV